MTMWTPVLNQNIPRYRALADAIALDLKAGRLRAGDRLPTHRELADALGVTVGTISRGYAEAERRGLTGGEVGRGTYVRGASAQDPWPDQTNTASDVVDLTLSLPVSLPEESEALATTLGQIGADPEIGRLLHYHAESASPHQRLAASNWLNRLGLTTKADDVLVTAGSQNGLNVVLSSLFKSGQVLLTGEITYPSIKSQARAYGVRLRGVALDEEGICPDGLEKALAMEPKADGLYLIPTLQNPTSGIMTEPRRRKIAQIAQEHELWIIEDDVHGFLLPEPPVPIAAIAPECTVYLASVAKCLAPGLRTGFIVAPERARTRLLTGIHTSLWMPPPLMVEVTTRWLSDGTADRIIDAKRREMMWRGQLVQRILAGHTLKSHPFGYQVWLELPEPWCIDAYVSQARERGVKVVGASAFAVNRRHIPHAVRLSIGTPSRADLERGLTVLVELLNDPTAATY